MEDWAIIQQKAKLIGTEEIEINKRINLIQMAAGNYQAQIDGNLTNPEDLTAEDQNTIRREFGIEEERNIDSNPLIPGDPVEDRQIREKKEREKGKKKHPADENPLIP